MPNEDLLLADAELGGDNKVLVVRTTTMQSSSTPHTNQSQSLAVLL